MCVRVYDKYVMIDKACRKENKKYKKKTTKNKIKLFINIYILI